MTGRLATIPLARLAAVAISAIALAYTEAALVVYLRELIAPIRSLHFPSAAREALPLLSVQQLSEAGEVFIHLLIVEVTREIAPPVVLLAMAWALRRQKGELVAFFLFGFGIWDVFYYVFLKVLLGWPPSLGTWDVLYLIPTAWVAPVWAPLVVSGTLILTGLAIVRRSGKRDARRRPIIAWLVLGVGTALVLTSFFLGTREAFQQVPSQFDWPVFLAGWTLAVASLAWLLWR